MLKSITLPLTCHKQWNLFFFYMGFHVDKSKEHPWYSKCRQEFRGQFEWCLLINKGCSKLLRMKKSSRQNGLCYGQQLTGKGVANCCGKFRISVGAKMTRFDPYNLYVHLRVLCKIPLGNIDSRYKVNMKCYENNISACHINASLFFLHLPLLEKPYPSMRAAVVTWSQEITRMSPQLLSTVLLPYIFDRWIIQNCSPCLCHIKTWLLQ